MEPIQPPQSTKPVVQELPHLVVDEPKRSKKGILAVIVLSLLLLGLPIGIFLVSQRTQLQPQAAVTEVTPESGAGIYMESKLSLDSTGGIIPVDVYVKSPNDSTNLVNAQIRFDPVLINVEKISTDSGELNIQPVFTKWIESSFDNNKGAISIIGGLPGPGAKTGSPNDDQIYLGTLFLKSKAVGTGILQISQASQILRNSDNVNIFKSGNDLVLNLTSPIAPPLPSPSNRRPETEEDLPLVVITSPITGANYSYFNSVGIVWSSFNTEIISQINLYVNGELFGPIAQNLEAVTGRLDWQPKNSLALHYIQPANTFEVEIIGVSKDGKVVKVLSGPFGLLGSETVSGNPPSEEAFMQNQLTVTDASRALTHYLALPLKDASLDLNKDGAINELDLFLIRENLLVRGIIK